MIIYLLLRGKLAASAQMCIPHNLIIRFLGWGSRNTQHTPVSTIQSVWHQDRAKGIWLAHSLLGQHIPASSPRTYTCCYFLILAARQFSWTEPQILTPPPIPPPYPSPSNCCSHSYRVTFETHTIKEPLCHRRSTEFLWKCLLCDQGSPLILGQYSWPFL